MRRDEKGNEVGAFEDFGRSGISYGVAIAGYGLLYVPLMRGYGLEPWTPTEAGLSILGCATLMVCIVEARRAWSEPRSKSDAA